MKKLLPSTENLFAIHFLLEPPATNGSPQHLFGIALQEIATGVQHVWSMLDAAEELNYPLSRISECCPELERYVLKSFKDFLRENPHAKWLHWGLSKRPDGFDIIWRRARYQQINLPPILAEGSFDLLAHFKQEHGGSFAPSPKLYEAAKMNECLNVDFLTDHELEEAWSLRKFGEVEPSLSSGVAAICDLFDRKRRETLVTATRGTSSSKPPTTTGMKTEAGAASGQDVATPTVVTPVSSIRAGAVPTALQPAEAEFEFHRVRGMYFVKGFGESGHVSADLKGLSQIHRLIKTPAESVSMLELDGCTDDDRIRNDRHSKQPVWDDQMRQQVADELTRLKAELARAERDHDEAAADRARAEIQELKEQAVADLGQNFSPRDMNNPFNRLRPKIWGTLKTAFKNLRASGLVTLAEHFETAIAADGTGRSFVYSPVTTPPPTWRTE